MIRITLWLLALVLAGCAGLTPVATTVRLPEDARAHPERYVVVTVSNAPGVVNSYAASTPRGYGGQGPYRAGADALALARRIAADHRLHEVAAWPIELLDVHCLVYELSEGAQRDDVLAALRRNPAVESAEPLSQFRLHASTYNDPYAPLQRNLGELDIVTAQQWSRGEGVRIAIIDTGVDTAHPDFAGRLDAVRDLVGDGGAAAETHGTAVAGIIAAVPNNGIGIAGIAPGARVLALRACWSVGGTAGECNSFTLAQALVAALDANASIVNLSLGGPDDPLLARIVERALKRGTIFVGAMPASGRREGFPTAIDGVIAVGAAERTERAPRVLYAPGTDIFTLAPRGRYDATSGSSVAAAEVSGIAALLLGIRPRLSAREVEDILGHSTAAADLPARVAASINACTALLELRRDGQCPAPGAEVARGR